MYTETELEAYLELFQNANTDDYLAFFSAKDDFTNSLSEGIIDKLRALGIQSDISGKWRYSFAVVWQKDNLIFEGLGSDIYEKIYKNGRLPNGQIYELKSSGYNARNISSIIINHVEMSKNKTRPECCHLRYKKAMRH